MESKENTGVSMNNFLESFFILLNGEGDLIWTVIKVEVISFKRSKKRTF